MAAMARYPQQPGVKGSLRWLQLVVNDHPSIIDKAVGPALSHRKVKWLSPLRSDDFAEYRDTAALERLGAQVTRTPLTSFWPGGGPQWDALGITEDGEPVLVEAKAHVPEFASTMKATAETSIDLIRSAIDKTARALGAVPSPAWLDGYYQYANRLAHVHFLRALNDVPAHLVFLYFIGDRDVGGPEGVDGWTAAIAQAHKALGLSGKIPSYVHDVFIDVRDVPSAPVPS
jgi:hypothetical protein